MKKVKYLVLIMIILLTGCGKKNNADILDSPDKVVARYCDILVKGNYGDILDIADMPESEFITKDAIEGAKSNFRERFMKNNNDAISCTYTKAADDNEKISYKLVINDSETKTIDVKKSNNKVMLDNIYTDADIYSISGSKVTIGGIDASKYKVDDNDTYFGWFTDHYKITILYDDNSTVEATHPLLSIPQRTSFKQFFRIVFPQSFNSQNHPNGNSDTSQLLEESIINVDDYNKIEKLANDVIFPLIKDVFDGNDVNKYNNYFVNADTSSLSNINLDSVERLNDDMSIYNFEIESEDKIVVCINYGYYSNGNSATTFFEIIKNDNDWKIEKVKKDILN